MGRGPVTVRDGDVVAMADSWSRTGTVVAAAGDTLSVLWHGTPGQHGRASASAVIILRRPVVCPLCHRDRFVSWSSEGVPESHEVTCTQCLTKIKSVEAALKRSPAGT